MPLDDAAAKVQLQKWVSFSEQGFAPWDSSQASSQLRRVFSECEIGQRTIELGCGGGASVRWLAAQGRESVGVDLVPATVEAAKAKAEAEGSAAEFIEADVFNLPSVLLNRFDFVYDSQCFHCLRAHGEVAAVEAIASLMKKGALLLVLTGNAREPEVGPAILSNDELELAFVGSRLFEAIDIREGRFDSTEYYATLPQCPLCWEGLFRRV